MNRMGPCDKALDIDGLHCRTSTGDHSSEYKYAQLRSYHQGDAALHLEVELYDDWPVARRLYALQHSNARRIRGAHN